MLLAEATAGQANSAKRTSSTVNSTLRVCYGSFTTFDVLFKKRERDSEPNPP